LVIFIAEQQNLGDNGQLQTGYYQQNLLPSLLAVFIIYDRYDVFWRTLDDERIQLLCLYMCLLPVVLTIAAACSVGLRMLLQTSYDGL